MANKPTREDWRLTVHRFQPPPARSLRQVVLAEIRQAILQGKLRPGDRLVEGDIAAQMGVSRGPVREALRQLEQDGLVVSHPYKETIVAETTDEEIVEVLLPIRVVLERYAARRAVPDLSAADVAALEAVVEEMQAAAGRQDLPLLVEKDLEFHQRLVELADHAQVSQIWSSIAGRIRAHFYRSGAYLDLHGVAAEHAELLPLLRRGDLDELLPLLERHIVDSPAANVVRTAAQAASTARTRRDSE